MNMRSFFALFAASSLTLFAQGDAAIFNRAPAEIDTALRARVGTFYQAHVDGKFRQASTVVAEDSQDTFFAADKPRYKSFKITHINYEENFTRAKVLVEVPWELLTPLGVINTVPRPISSLWRLENGAWFWYVVPYDPCKGIEVGSFGTMHKETCVDGKVVEKPETSSPGGIPNPGDWMTPGAIQKMIRLSEERILISSHKPTSMAVRIESRFPGEATLQLDPVNMPGLSASLAAGKIASGESVALQVAYDPPSPQRNPDQEIRIRVNPTGQVLKLTVAFDAPPAKLFNEPIQRKAPPPPDAKVPGVQLPGPAKTTTPVKAPKTNKK